MKLTKTFRLSGLLVAAGILIVVVTSRHGGPRALGIVLLCLAGPVFFVSLARYLLRGLLWSVGRRLAVSYLLLLAAFAFGAVFLYGAALMLAGQLGTRRVELALVKHESALAGLARDRAEQGSGGPTDPVAARPWMKERAVHLVKQGSEIFAVAVEPRPKGPVLATQRIDREFRKGLERETGCVVTLFGAVHVQQDANDRKGVTVSFDRGAKPKKSVNVSEEADSGGEGPGAPDSAAPAAGAGPWHGRWTAFPLFVPQPVRDADSGEPLESRPLLFLVRTSLAREATELFQDARVEGVRQIETGRLVLGVMGGLAIATLAVFFGASLLAGLLTSRIARATSRLSAGFAEIDKGNFAHRARVRGHDQLAALVASFNHMAGRLSESVETKAQQEALERELALARDLQRRLLPPPGFAFPGVSIAVDFRPAAAIGGDFYDLAGDAKTLTVVVADVSGHGLPTGIVMAAAKASLSALAHTGATGPRLMELLDTEIVRTTDSRTFVTLAHLVFDFAAKTVAFTNAGHPYPYRVKPDGTLEALANPARPLGLGLPPGWSTVTSPLAPGDLWVVYSDGLVEAAAAEGGEPWGFARLEQCLKEGAGATASELRDRILAAQRAHTGRDETADDRTLLVLRIEESVTASA
jgi:sigma-B regulation protein RsbU (phosphoserine phosphatase)